jgi:hypothetical protein
MKYGVVFKAKNLLAKNGSGPEDFDVERNQHGDAPRPHARCPLDVRKQAGMGSRTKFRIDHPGLTMKVKVSLFCYSGWQSLKT